MNLNKKRVSSGGLKPSTSNIDQTGISISSGSYLNTHTEKQSTYQALQNGEQKAIFGDIFKSEDNMMKMSKKRAQPGQAESDENESYYKPS